MLRNRGGPPKLFLNKILKIELNYLKIPSCLFSVSRNQRNNLRTFEDFGHYLSFEKKEFKDTKKITQLLKLLVENYSRFKKLCNTKFITVDGNGNQSGNSSPKKWPVLT